MLVKIKSNIFQSEQQNFLESYGATLLEKFEFPADIFKNFDGELVRVRLPEGQSAEEAVARMSQDNRVAFAVTNDIYTLDDFEVQQQPDDLDGRLWGLNNTGQNGGTPDADIDAPEAWSVTTGQNGPLIAILDTGIDYNHPDLKANLWTNPGEIPGDGIDNDGNGVVDDIHGYNAYADNGDPMDAHSHGTHVAGTIGAVGDNGEGVVGVNWHANMMAVKIFDDSGRTSADAIIRGILYATNQGARITSNSWGGGRENQAIMEAFANSPALHIAAAGNSGTDNDRRPHYPSNYDMPNMVAVAATDRNDRLASFSNYGESSVDIAAPGVDIFSTMPGGGYGNKSGTSMATPQVSGAAALILSKYPDLSNQELKERLFKGAEKQVRLDQRVVTGARLNVANSLDIDRLAPATPDDFAVREAHINRVDLGLTATGDDGWCNQADAYDLRMSNSPITSEEEFARATKVEIGKPGPAQQDQVLSVPLTPSTQERQLYFGLKVADNVGNISGLATASTSVPAAHSLYSEGFEGDVSGWQAEGKWGLKEVNGRGKVFTDSPDGNYENNADFSLTSPVIDLAQADDATLLMDARHYMEKGYDRVTLEATGDGGESWQSLKEFSGEAAWHKESIDLSAFDGGQVQLRFRLTTDQSVSKDGFSFDELQIVGNPPPPEPPPES